MALNVGDRLGHYNVTALVGEGGMGQIYRATDTQLNCTCRVGLPCLADTAQVATAIERRAPWHPLDDDS